MDYSKLLGKKVTSLKPSGIRRFFDIAASMKDAISLGIGEPDFITPREWSAAAIQSINDGMTQYTSNAGELGLREAISEFIERQYDVKYNPATEMLVTVGSSEAIDLVLRAILNDGDEVLIPEPNFVAYAPLVAMSGGVPIPIPSREENNFKITAQEIQSSVTKKTKAIFIAYPCNPTGAIMTRDDLAEIVPAIIKNDLFVISDEIYSELTYNGIKHTSIASFPGMWERTAYTNGFSKYFAMTGWRVGYVAAPEAILSQCYKIHQYGIMCAPTAGQMAAKAALQESFKDDFKRVREMRDSYDQRRKFLWKSFNDMGLFCFEPKGAFYCFPSVKSTGLTAEEFCERLLMEKKVAVVPGTAFGDAPYNFRACYAVSMEKLEKAVKLIGEFLQELKAEKM
jgi:aminotransferase